MHTLHDSSDEQVQLTCSSTELVDPAVQNELLEQSVWDEILSKLNQNYSGWNDADCCNMYKYIAARCWSRCLKPGITGWNNPRALLRDAQKECVPVKRYRRLLETDFNAACVWRNIYTAYFRIEKIVEEEIKWRRSYQQLLTPPQPIRECCEENE